ncbi:MAG TPA: DUF4270 domain-containing protein [Draconibacterium sp.]|nr:DUF4270 domain-containing protein [Draconibacterium sp.]
MKRKIRLKNSIFTGLAALMALFFYGCNKSNELGMELLPSSDLIKVKNTIIKDDISGYTFREDSVRTDEQSHSLLGSFTDPRFGNTTVDFATQFRLSTYPKYGTNPVADSVKLYLYYRYIYGDTVTSQRIRAYELESPINADAKYYENADLKSMASDQLLGEAEFTPKIALDSITSDTLYQLIVIPLDVSLGEKLVNADSLQMINNDVFLEFFKGLYIETEKVTGDGGAILSLDAASNSTFQGSALVVYYNNDENVAADTPDTLSMPYIITQFSARVNHFEHDYSGTAFNASLNSESNADSLIYIQSTGGLESKIIIDNISNWVDSTDVAINKAELIFQIDTMASDLEKYPPPSQLLFIAINDDGSQYLPVDYLFSPTFYGGRLNADYTYHFNITQHVQQIIDGIAGNNGFYLTTAKKGSEANRVVLKGSTSGTGIKLIITYSKFRE